jgi:hypothetical protein
MGHEGPEGEYRYSSTLSLTLALNGGGWSTPRPGHFTPGKETRYPLYRRLGGPQGRSGPAGFKYLLLLLLVGATAHVGPRPSVSIL